MHLDALLCAESHPGRSPKEPTFLRGTVIASQMLHASISGRPALLPTPSAVPLCLRSSYT